MRTLFFVVLLGLLGNVCLAQSNTNVTDRRNIFDEKGDYYFDQLKYKKAIVHYNMAFAKDADDYYSVLRKAEAYTELEMFPQAAECYRLLFESNLRIPNVYRLQYAFVLLEIDNAQGFEEWLGKYNDIVESEIKGKNYISTEADRGKLYKDSTIILVKNVAHLNTKESEINPVVYDNQLLFSSTRKNIRGDFGNDFYNVFVASYTNTGEFDQVELYNTQLNSSKNEGAPTFFDVTNSMYFTRSTSLTSNFKTYTSNIPMDRSDEIDVSGMSVGGFSNIGHVNFNSNGLVMYFVSESSEGKGGLDIYTSTMVNGDWDTPKNLGPTINTSGDEMYPFILNDSILYFSSNGHDGQGGFDLYSVNLNNDDLKVQNQGSAINSSFDDYGLAFAPGGNTGYFSSNRPGGKGREDIYRVNILNLKIKYAAYKHKLRTSMEDGKINLYLSNGDEYNIASEENAGFNFSFLPEEDFKMVIQHEDATLDKIVNNKSLSADQKKQAVLKPKPIQQTEIKLQAGMKYQFTAGMKPISSQYVADLKDMTSTYQDPNTSTIDLTALAKELQFTNGEIYTIRFVKDTDANSGYKSKGESSLFVGDEVVSVFGRSFLIVLPLDVEANFNIQTDIAHFKENFNPKKVGVVVDQSSVFPDENSQKWLISMLVNTDSIEMVRPSNMLTAQEISIIPGTEYILTLGKLDPITNEKIEIIVPLTRGVKYNLGSTEKSKDKYKKALAELVLGRKDIEPSNEELIDISVLSKAIEVSPGEDLSFNLLPAKKFGAQATEAVGSTSLTLDGKEYDIYSNEMYTVNVPYDVSRELNIETDIDYIIDNFEPEDYILALDTIPFFGEIWVDTTGLSTTPEWLSMSVNTESAKEVDKQNQLMAQEVSIIPGKEYILTVSKIDAVTGKETEIIVPLTREVKYDFTSDPESDEVYQKSLEQFLKEQEDFKATDGELIDISILSKELEIKEGDKVSFSLLPAKVFRKDLPKTEVPKSSLFLDDKVVEFTQIQKYTINMPLENTGQVNIQTDVNHLQKNFEPGTYTLDVDTTIFFSEITVDTTGYWSGLREDEITDPVFDVVVVNFGLNEYSLSSQAKSTIESKVVGKLNSDNRLYVTITGYTDGLGNAEHNKKLSQNRSQSVKDFLAARGVGENRIRTFSFGESQTLDEGVKWEDLDEAELAKHRKVEIVIYLPE